METGMESFGKGVGIGTCPWLPEALPSMSHRDLALARERGASAYVECALRYGQYLWTRGMVARAILALTRGLYACQSTEPRTGIQHPLPYGAIGWMVMNHAGGDFPGNPRVSFEHQAVRSRGRGTALAQRKARAWGVWLIVRERRPDLPGDPRLNSQYPEPDAVEGALERYGLPGEKDLWVFARSSERGLPS